MKLYSSISDVKGLFIGWIIILIWLGSLLYLLNVNISTLSFIFILLGIAWQTFLYTGLFITAHDAMHGTVFPKSRKFNDFMGSLALRLFALMSYKKIIQKHWEHHQNPASQKDPDYHDGRHTGFFLWYAKFMMNYLTVKQILGMAIVFNIFLHIFHLPVSNLIMFWIVPSLLSTVQLFYFGTFLPHRESGEPFQDDHRARSNDYKVFWSFLSCYHFGYHWEHHEYPHVPWWQLPFMRKMILAKTR